MATQEIQQFIEEHIAKGATPEQVKAAGIQEGWTTEEMNGAYAIYAIHHGDFAPKNALQFETARSATPAPHIQRLALLPIIIILGSLATIAEGYYQNVMVSKPAIPVQSATSTQAAIVKGTLSVPAYVPAPIAQTVSTGFPATKIVAHGGSHTATNTGSNGTVPKVVPPTTVVTIPTVPTTQNPVPSTTPVTPVVAVNVPSSPSTPTPNPVQTIPAPVVIPDPDPGPEPDPVILPPLPPPPPLPDPLPDPVPDPVPPVVVPPAPTTTPSTTPPVVVPPVVVPPVVVPPPVVPPVIVAGSYETYAGCASPSTTYTRTVYVDPVNGSETLGDGSQAKPYHTLREAFIDKRILPGDKVILMPGDHGNVFISSAKIPALANPSNWIWIDSQPGAIVDSYDIRAVRNMLITNATIHRTSTGNAFSAVSGGNVILADSNIYGTLDSSGWSAADWMSAASAISSSDNTCTSILRNSILNVRFGIIFGTRATDPAATVMNVLIKGNTIRNYSADGILPEVSNVAVLDNKAYDEYVSPADGDGNHDDAIQFYAGSDAITLSNFDVENNWLQESTNPNRNLNAGQQGIDILGPGQFSNMTVKYNTIINSSYYGVVLGAAPNTIIANNTIVSNSSVFRHMKLGYYSAAKNTIPINSVVKNNIDPNGAILAGEPGVTASNNYIANVDPATLFVTFNRITDTYDLHPKPGSAIDGIGVGALPTGPISMAPHNEHMSLLASVGSAFESIASAIWHFIQSIF